MNTNLKYSNNKGFTFIEIILLIVAFSLIVLIGTSVYYFHNKNISPPNSFKFSGRITSLKSFGPDQGGGVIINNTVYVQTALGFVYYPNDAIGKIIGFPNKYPSNNDIGQTVNVFAKKTSLNNYTIFGSNKYYIKLQN